MTWLCKSPAGDREGIQQVPERWDWHDSMRLDFEIKVGVGSAFA